MWEVADPWSIFTRKNREEKGYGPGRVEEKEKRILGQNIGEKNTYPYLIGFYRIPLKKLHFKRIMTDEQTIRPIKIDN